MLCDTKHEYELQSQLQTNSSHDRQTYVNIDSQMMGVGGYDSWTPNVDEEYQLLENSDNLNETSILLKMNNNNNTNINEFYKDFQQNIYN